MAGAIGGLARAQRNSGGDLAALASYRGVFTGCGQSGPNWHRSVGPWWVGPHWGRSATMPRVVLSLYWPVIWRMASLKVLLKRFSFCCSTRAAVTRPHCGSATHSVDLRVGYAYAPRLSGPGSWPGYLRPVNAGIRGQTRHGSGQEWPVATTARIC